MANKKTKKASPKKGPTGHRTTPAGVKARKPALAPIAQTLLAHAHALTAHALALSAHAHALSAAAPSQQIVNCVFDCLRQIAPGASITNNSILSRIPIPDLVALGQCINDCVPLSDPSCWGGGVVIDGSWRVSDLIHETETLRSNA